MGLDMFLEARRQNSDNSFEVAYWRKANAIHKWFVENVQEGKDDCGEYLVSRDHLVELLDTCQEVLRHRELAPQLLPSKSGFFFGSMEYDEWYFEDIKWTAEKLQEILVDESFEDLELYYSSSW